MSVGGEPLKMQMTVPATPVKPHRMLPVFQKMTNSFVEMSAVSAGARGETVSCRAGCDACFAQFILIWRAHYRFSRRYGLEDPYTIFLNILLLFLVLFYVYPLKFVFTLIFRQLTGAPIGSEIGLHEASVLMRIYASGFISVFTLFALMYARAYKLRRELGLNKVETLETRVAVQECLIMASVGIISFALAFKNPGWAGWSYFLLAPALSIHGSVYGKRVRLMAEKLGLG